MAPTSQSQAAAQTQAPTGVRHGAVHPIAPARLYDNPSRPDAVAVGTIVWLSSELMFFGALFAAYFTIRGVTNAAVTNHADSLWAQGAGMLNVPFAVANTIVLVLSSVTCQLGVLKSEHGQVGRTGSLLNVSRWGLREWYITTFVMGSVFIGGQIFEYAELFHEGLSLSSDVYGSVFFLATGFHGLHVIGGLVAFLFVLGRTYLARRFTHEQVVSTMAVSYYWHFVDIVWIVLFSVIYLLQ